MKNILFPTDFSENAENALWYALNLAKDSGAKLHIINSYELPYSHSGMSTSLMDLMRTDSENGLKKVLELIKTSSGFENVLIETSVLAGDVINTVDHYAKTHGIDLTVMGTKGASGLQEVLIGSTTQGVIQEVNSSVLAIPQGTEYKAPSKIAFASDLKEVKDVSQFKTYFEFCKKYNTETYIVNVVEGDTVISALGNLEELALAKMFNDVPHSFFFEINKKVVEGINKFIEEKNCDMLAVFSREYNFIEKILHKSVTNQLVFHTKKPLFVIK